MSFSRLFDQTDTLFISNRIVHPFLVISYLTIPPLSSFRTDRRECEKSYVPAGNDTFRRYVRFFAATLTRNDLIGVSLFEPLPSFRPVVAGKREYAKSCYSFEERRNLSEGWEESFI